MPLPWLLAAAAVAVTAAIISDDDKKTKSSNPSDNRDEQIREAEREKQKNELKSQISAIKKMQKEELTENLVKAAILLNIDADEANYIIHSNIKKTQISLEDQYRSNDKKTKEIISLFQENEISERESNLSFLEKFGIEYAPNPKDDNALKSIRDSQSSINKLTKIQQEISKAHQS